MGLGLGNWGWLGKRMGQTKEDEPRYQGLAARNRAAEDLIWQLQQRGREEDVVFVLSRIRRLSSVNHRLSSVKGGASKF